MKLKTYFWAMLGLLIPVAAFADVTMTALTSGQINTYVGYLNWATFFHVGGSLVPALLIWIAHIRGWLGTQAGMADLNDAETILGAAKDILLTNGGEASKHPGLGTAVTVLNVGIADAKAAAVPPVAPTIPPAAKMLVLGLLFLGMAGIMRADTAWNEFDLGGNFGAGGAVYGIQPGGFFEATGTIAATYGLNLSYTGYTTTTVEATSTTAATITTTSYNYFIVSAGPSYEPHTSAMGGNAGGYLGAYIEGGTQIPDTPDNLMAGIIGDFFTGAPQPIGGIVSVNFPLGQPWIRKR